MVGRVKGLNVQVKLVADLRQGIDAEARAKVVPHGKSASAKPRVDIKTEVETYGASSETTTFEGGGNLNAATAVNTPSQLASQTGVRAGGGVLGHLLNARLGALDKASEGPGAIVLPPFVEDPTQTRLDDLKRFVGMDVTVTVYDPDEYGSLADANKRGDSIDSRGVLKGISDEGLELQDPATGKTRTLDPELWTVGEVEVGRGPYAHRKDSHMTLRGVAEELLPGAPIAAQVVGSADKVAGRFAGVGDDKQGLYLDLVDDAGQAHRLRNLYDVTSPGYTFTALQEA